jgi:hypothetical protein
MGIVPGIAAGISWLGRRPASLRAIFFWLPSPILVRVHPKVRRNFPLDHDGPSGAKTHFDSFGTPHTHFQKKRSIEGAALSNAMISPSGKW